ncbi:putative 4-hydroxy-4-methyl-2-oxoglutarate aldolase [Shewanella yunxiaonensis]|uniref:4-hydroxy-4-methyl-2-oxoglutarate aldolase n=1 Tax=Shewanella yunxiaonensis TaxID=2829809 RepID=A0ABX7YX71_9GAMM|nr:putative 4-hydroxy-4-methyl-2-oxoglutarate aldolase [Shewanella yunxiaonensis]QUN07395.1 putative 4-hydroxy-4-methyl-2-oxoglutarate aldolase [Shewanella yunxiaonensis]
MLDLLPDLFDTYPEQIQLLSLPLTQYGGKHVFWGEVVTVYCFEDNSMVKQLLARPGQGRVLVVDGGGSLDKALMGDLIGQSAADNGWAGVVINGAIRDAGALSTMPIGIKALGTNPIKTERKGLGDVNCPLVFGKQTVAPGMFIYADDNGLAVSNTALDLSLLG